MNQGSIFRWAGGENLHADSIKKPRSVRGNVRRLIGPIVEIVVAEQADVGHEDSRVDVDSVKHIEMISAIGFGNITIGTGKIPLAVAGARIIPRRRDRIHSELGHEPGADVVVVEIAAYAQLLELNFVRAEELARAADGVIRWMVEVGNVVGVDLISGVKNFVSQ